MMQREFEATNLALWKVDGTAMTVVTDADIPPGRWRTNMREDLARARRGDITLPCVHWSRSFEGKSGTHVHGRGWKLHVPQTDPFDLWVGAERASVGDWTDVTPAWAKACGCRQGECESKAAHRCRMSDEIGTCAQ